MKRFRQILSATLAVAVCGVFMTACSSSGSSQKADATQLEVDNATELSGDITFWHSFTQGPRLETIQAAADEFMKQHPKVKIKIDTFSWNDFYTKWTTGLASGNVPDMATALTPQIAEMIHADAILPTDDVIDSIGKDRFSSSILNQTAIDNTNYAVPLYSHAQVMWIRKDLLDKANLGVPQTWDELAETAKKLTKDGVYGLSFPMGTNDFIATRMLNLYVRSHGESLLTDDLKANLTSKAALEGIKYFVDLYNTTSPKDSINYNVLQQATLYYQGKTAFDFNSGFQIGGVKANEPELLQYVDAYPVPKIKANDQEMPHEASTISLVFFKNSKHKEVAKAFAATLYQKERYIKFLQSVPVGMLPVISGISDDPLYKADPVIKQFSHAEKVIQDAVNIGAEIGFEHGPNLQAGLLVNNHEIEKMFQEIVTGKKDIATAAKDAEDRLNLLFETAK